MCGVCGCGEGEVTIGGKDGHRHHHHSHAQDHDHAHGHQHNHGQRDWHAVELDILAKNDGYAEANRVRFAGLGVLALNLVSSPGAGKTSLLTATAAALDGRMSMAVIEGDQATENDAARIRAAGVPAVQINTGRVCHLDAHMIGHAMDGLTLGAGDVLFIENVGNLVCPATFDLGEHAKVAVLSVTEGDDKPAKYPDMFMAADLMVLNKIDLLPHVDFDVARCIAHARALNPDIEVLELSARTGEGMAGWVDWLARTRDAVQASPTPHHAHA